MNKRAEAIVARGVGIADLDDGLAPLIVALAEASVDVAVTGVENAPSAACRLINTGPGRIIVVDTRRGVNVGAVDASSTVVWEPRAGTFEDWWTRQLWRAGIAEDAIDRVERDGQTDLFEVFRSQLRMRTEGALPETVSTPGWILHLDSAVDGRRPPIHPSLLALSDGTTSIVGDLDAGADSTTGFVLAAGAYGLGRDGLVRPLPGPASTHLGRRFGRAEEYRWTLDLHAGTLTRDPIGEGTRTIRFLSLARPGIGAMRSERAVPGTWADPLCRPRVSQVLSADHRYVAGVARPGSTPWAETISDRSAIAVAAVQRVWTVADTSRIERITATRSGGTACRSDACAAVADARLVGFDRLLRDHRQAWGERWTRADIEIDGDPDAQLAVRFALFHLLSCAAVDGEAPVGARGLTGLAYAGHVFWDADVFVLPALAATVPAAARAMLEYRIRRLGAARAEAVGRGLPGARFPWESADQGSDVTPRSVRDVEGRIVPIRTGEHEEHINSDVAWAALHYVDWTGDSLLLEGDGQGLVVETARYLAGRVRIDQSGRGHLDGVIGPDEYHEMVDDNAYTNLMARWHLRQAARLTARNGGHDEAGKLAKIAESLVVGFDPETRRHEQFAGFWTLEPLLIGDIAEPPVAADVLLGRERLAASQVIKQPDVMMAHHLIPDECGEGSAIADLDFYLPRTAHGSSLSPAICAALLARAGRPDEAMPLFDLAARLDLDDLTRSTSGGLHLATMGGLWQAVVYGFAGIGPCADGLHIDPWLPTRWTSLRINLEFRGRPVTVTIGHDIVTVDAEWPVPVVVAGHVATGPTQLPISVGVRSAR